MTALESLTRPPAITFMREGVPPPSPLYVTPDDVLDVFIVNSVANQSIRLAGRILLPEGRVQTFEQQFAVVNTRTEETFSVPLQEGFLLNLALFTNVTTRKGQTYVRASLRRGAIAVGVLHAILAQGYAEVGHSPSWPVIHQPHPIDGRGFIRSLAGTNPAAGVEIIETVPTNARWRILSLTAQLVTDATVSSRNVHIVVDDGTTILYELSFGFTHAASLTIRYNAAPAAERSGLIDSTAVTALPLWPDLREGFRIRTLTSNLQAGDNWGAPQLWVEEWIEF